MRGLAIFIAAGAVAASGSARADVESETVKAGVRAYDDLDYPKAIEHLTKALGETLTREERVITYRTLGFAHIGSGDSKAARGDFEKLLRIDPGHQLDRTISPLVRTVFEEAKAAVATGTAAPAAGLPELGPEVRPALAQEGEPVVISAYLPGGVAVSLQVFYRTRGQASFSRVAAEGHLGRFEVTLPGMQVSAPAIEYYALAIDDAGGAVAGSGTLGAPLSIEVAGARGGRVGKVAIGVVGVLAVAGAIAGIVAAVLANQMPRPDAPAAITIIPQ